jgi:hypothetical protein
MKRLPSAPLTREDLWIWAGRYTRRSWTEVSTGDAFVAQMNVIGQDNRDAELMFERMNHWEWGRTPPHKWWFEDWPGPDGRSRTPFDDACYT